MRDIPMTTRELLIITLKALDKTNWETLRYLLKREGAEMTVDYIEHCLTHPKERLYEQVADQFFRIADKIENKELSSQVATVEELIKVKKTEQKFLRELAEYWSKDETIRGRELQRKAEAYKNALVTAYGDVTEEKENKAQR